jgi:hypothetical protein
LHSRCCQLAIIRNVGIRKDPERSGALGTAAGNDDDVDVDGVGDDAVAAGLRSLAPPSFASSPAGWMWRRSCT